MGDLLLVQYEGANEAEFSARFQQVTPAVMAKGVEDTAFYRYNRLVSLNEVGGDPGLFGRSVEAFHAHCLKTAEKWPATMLTLSTHDTSAVATCGRGQTCCQRSRRSGSHGPAVGRAQRAPSGAGIPRPKPRIPHVPDDGRSLAGRRAAAGGVPAESRPRSQCPHLMDQPVQAFEDALTQFAGSVMADAEFKSDLESFIGRHQLVALGGLRRSPRPPS